MATIVPTQQPIDGAQLTKPTDWAHFMVTAALKFASDEKTPVTYASTDDARLDILNTLNWFEAHSEYEWPNFTRLGFDFSQAMRFRRALVSDVFVALQRAGNIKIGSEAGGGLGTPESGTVRAAKRSGAGSRRMAERKRQCKREDESDTDAASEDSDKSFWDDQEFLAETMHELIGRTSADILGYLRGKKSPDALANTIHDGLVSVWEGPMADYGSVQDNLERKRLLWAQGKTLVTRRSGSPELGEQRTCGQRSG